MRVEQQKRLISAVVVSLLFALSPVIASAAPATGSSNTAVSVTVEPVISISTSSTVAFSVVPTSGGSVSSASDTVSVSTNNTTGYTLKLADGDASTNLTSGGNTIPAHTAGSFGTPTALAVNSWGYRIVGAGGFGAGAYTGETNQVSSSSTWAGVPASGSAVTIKTTGSTATADTTTVWYGANVSTLQPNGTYTDTVTYTATTN